MATDLTFDIIFNSQKSLSDLRKNITDKLKDIDFEINPKILDSRARSSKVQQNVVGNLDDKLKGLFEAIVEAQKKLDKANSRRLAGAENSPRSIAGLDREVKKNKDALEAASNAYRALLGEINSVNAAFKELKGGLIAQAQQQKLLRPTNTPQEEVNRLRPFNTRRNSATSESQAILNKTKSPFDSNNVKSLGAETTSLLERYRDDLKAIIKNAEGQVNPDAIRLANAITTVLNERLGIEKNVLAASKAQFSTIQGNIADRKVDKTSSIKSTEERIALVEKINADILEAKLERDKANAAASETVQAQALETQKREAKARAEAVAIQNESNRERLRAAGISKAAFVKELAQQSAKEKGTGTALQTNPAEIRSLLVEKLNKKFGELNIDGADITASIQIYNRELRKLFDKSLAVQNRANRKQEKQTNRANIKDLKGQLIDIENEKLATLREQEALEQEDLNSIKGYAKAVDKVRKDNLANARLDAGQTPLQFTKNLAKQTATPTTITPSVDKENIDKLTNSIGGVVKFNEALENQIAKTTESLANYANQIASAQLANNAIDKSKQNIVIDINRAKDAYKELTKKIEDSQHIKDANNDLVKELETLRNTAANTNKVYEDNTKLIDKKFADFRESLGFKRGSRGAGGPEMDADTQKMHDLSAQTGQGAKFLAATNARNKLFEEEQNILAVLKAQEEDVKKYNELADERVRLGQEINTLLGDQKTLQRAGKSITEDIQSAQAKTVRAQTSLTGLIQLQADNQAKLSPLKSQLSNAQNPQPTIQNPKALSKEDFAKKIDEAFLIDNPHAIQGLYNNYLKTFADILNKSNENQKSELDKRNKIESDITEAGREAFNKTRQQQGRGGGGFGGNGGGGRGPAPPSGPPPNSGPIQDIVDKLSAADKAAIRFGQSVGAAAERLAAWATPSALIFKTISSLQQAVGEVIKLDTATRRLIFFQGAGNLEGFNKDIEDATKRTELLDTANENLIKTAKETGLTLDQVAVAANTVARIGELAFLPDGTQSELLKATLALTQVEGAEITADRAAELLNATIQQFGISLSDVGQVAAKFSIVATETSSNMEQLATLVTRFGSAASNIQGLTFDKTLSLAAIASKALGTNTFRAATALRNLTIGIAKNASEIEKMTGVDVIDENGILKGEDALFKVLGVVQDLNRTGQQVKLGKLLGDAQNIPDIITLSTILPKLQQSFKDLNDPIKATAITLAQVKAFQTGVILNSDSLQSNINRLNTAFADLAKTLGASSLVRGTVGGFTSLVNGSTESAKAIEKLGIGFRSLEAIAVVVLGNIAKKALLTGKGVFDRFKSNFEGQDLQSQILGAPQAKEKSPFEKGLENATRAGALSADKAALFAEAQNKSLEKSLIQQANLNALKAQRVILEKNNVAFADKLQSTDQQILNLERNITKETERQNLIRNNAAKAVAKGAAFKKIGESVSFLLPALLAGANEFGGDAIASAIADGIDGNKDKIRTAVTSALNLGALGASIGSLFGPQGTAIGAAIGISTGVAFSDSFQDGVRDAAKAGQEAFFKEFDDVKSGKKASLNPIKFIQTSFLTGLDLVLTKAKEAKSALSAIFDGSAESARKANIEQALLVTNLGRVRQVSTGNDQVDAVLENMFNENNKIQKLINDISEENIKNGKEPLKGFGGGKLTLDQKQRAAQEAKSIEAAEKQGELQKQLAEVGIRIKRNQEELAAAEKDSTKTPTQIKEIKDKILADGERQLILEDELGKKEIANKEHLLQLETKLGQIKRESSALTNINKIRKELEVKRAELSGDKNNSIEIPLAFDTRDSEIKIQEISRTIEEKKKEIDRLGATGPSNRDEKLRLTKDISDLEDKQNEERANIISKEIEAQNAHFNLVKEEAKLIVTAYSTAADELRNANAAALQQFGNLQNARNERVSAFRTLNESISEAQKVNPTTGQDIQGQEALQAARENAARVADVLADNIAAGVDSRLTNIPIKDFDNVQAALQEYLVVQKEVNESAEGAQRIEKEARLAQLKVQIDAFNAQVALQRQGFDLLKDRLSQLSDNIKDVISAQKAHIEELHSAAQAQAALGKEAVTNPDEFLKTLQKAFQARTFLQGVQGEIQNRRAQFAGPDNQLSVQEERIAAARVIAEQIQKKEGKGQLEFIAGLIDAAESLDKFHTTIAGLTGADLADLVSRAVLTPTEVLVNEVEEQVTTAQKIADNNKLLIETNNQLIGVAKLRAEAELNLAKLEDARRDILQKEFNLISQNLLPKALDSLAYKANLFGVRLTALSEQLQAQEDLIKRGITDITLGGTENILLEVNQALQEFSRRLKEARPDINPPGNGPKGTKASSKIDNSGSGSNVDFRPLLDEFVNRISGIALKLDTTIPPIELSINANIKTVIEGNDFLDALKEKLAGTDLESKVEDIQKTLLELVTVERSRGTNLRITSGE